MFVQVYANRFIGERIINIQKQDVRRNKCPFYSCINDYDNIDDDDNDGDDGDLKIKHLKKFEIIVITKSICKFILRIKGFTNMDN